MEKEQTAWQKHLMKTYKEMQKKDKGAKFTEAMKEAKKTYKK